MQKMIGLCTTENGPKMMNCCKPEQVGTKEHGKMWKRIQILEDGRILAKEARNWKIEGLNRRITRKEFRSLWNELEKEAFMAQKGLWNVARQRMLRTEVHCPTKKETFSDSTRPCVKKKILSSWLREDVESTEERSKEMDREAKEEENRSG